MVSFHSTHPTVLVKIAAVGYRNKNTGQPAIRRQMRQAMGLRFTILASGSGGNAALVKQRDFGLLIDAGPGPSGLPAGCRPLAAIAGRSSRPSSSPTRTPTTGKTAR